MRTWFVFFAISVVTAAFATAVMFHMAVFRDRDVFFLYARTWSRILLRLAGIRVVSFGLDTIHPTERYVYTCNHASLFDIPVVLATIPDNIRIMYKRELEKIPVFGWCLKMSPFIAIDRADGRDAMARLEETVASMRAGSSVLVFPEGTRSEDGRVAQFKRGAFVLAARSGKPLIPVALVGTHNILPARTRRIVPGTVELHVENAVVLESPVSRQAESAAMASVRTSIGRHVDLQV